MLAASLHAVAQISMERLLNGLAEGTAVAADGGAYKFANAVRGVVLCPGGDGAGPICRVGFIVWPLPGCRRGRDGSRRVVVILVRRVGSRGGARTGASGVGIVASALRAERVHAGRPGRARSPGSKNGRRVPLAALCRAAGFGRRASSHGDWIFPPRGDCPLLGAARVERGPIEFRHFARTGAPAPLG